MNKDYVWVEKYRPKTVEEAILPSDLQKTFKEFVEQKTLPNMIFVGKPGIGKTTIARALCNELGFDYIFINGSDERNIDVLRGKIRDFASTVSFSDGPKVVILDEADYLNPQSTQPALRGFIEEFSKNCRFILTCNYKDKIIEPLHSRCSVYHFNSDRKTLAKLAGKFYKRMLNILNEEGIAYDDKAVAELITKYAPDWRRVINECQRYSSAGKIDVGILHTLSEKSFMELAKDLKSKNFKNMRTWVVNNMDIDASTIFRGLYDHVAKLVKPNSIPELILIIARYQYQAAFVADQEINLVACMTEIMSDMEWQ
jgi:DNA polymerase III delta prime subunit